MFYVLEEEESKQDQSYWTSYADLTTGLLLIFILLVVAMLARSQHYSRIRMKNEHAYKKEIKKLKLITEKRKEIMKQLEAELIKKKISYYKVPGTAIIRFPPEVRFKTGDYHLQPEGEKYLRKFIPSYISIIMKKDFRDYVKAVIIEGHTDPRKGYLYNLRLSHDRAREVVAFHFKNSLLDEVNIGDIETSQITKKVQKLIMPVGRSKVDPICGDLPCKDNGKESDIDFDKSRRVEIRFQMKDEETLRKILKLLDKIDFFKELNNKRQL